MTESEIGTEKLTSWMKIVLDKKPLIGTVIRLVIQIVVKLFWNKANFK